MNTEIATALSKALAHKAAGNHEKALHWTRILVRELREAGLPVSMQIGHV